MDDHLIPKAPAFLGLCSGPSGASCGLVEDKAGNKPSFGWAGLQSVEGITSSTIAIFACHMDSMPDLSLVHTGT